jgi:hypothetical protein
MRLYEIAAEADPVVFDTSQPWYHGSKVNGFWEFDRAFLRSGIVNTNSSGGFYFAANREAAEYFSDTETAVKDSDGVWNYDDIQIYGDEGEHYLLISYAEDDAISADSSLGFGTTTEERRAEVNRGPYNTSGAAYAAGRVIIDQFNAAETGETFYHDDKIIAVYLALGRTIQVHDNLDHFRSAERTARAEGYDSILATDIHDGWKTSDVAVVFDPRRIRII